MTWDNPMQVCPVLADMSPANTSISGHWSGAINRLHFAEGAFVVFNEVFAIGSYRKGATRVKNDVDDVIFGTSREKRGHKVWVKVGALHVGVECKRQTTIIR